MTATIPEGTAPAQNSDDVALAERLKTGYDDIRREIAKLIVGQDQVVDLVLLSLFTGGNSLIVGVPGLAKTLLINTIAQVLDLKFSRIQFTPSLYASLLGTAENRSVEYSHISPTSFSKFTMAIRRFVGSLSW